ncbi:MAG: NAD(P)H-dependent oxidoreductase [Pseudomonadota bacterium]
MPTLLLQSSARTEGSISRELAADLAARLGGDVTARDLAAGFPHVTPEWIGANFTPPADRSDAQKATLALSDELIAELMAADTLVFGVAIYNFGVPAPLKQWIDHVCRAGITFKYSEAGPVGLLEGKKAYIVAASGGTPVGSPIDYATTYLTHVLGFIGISDVTVVAADQLVMKGEESITRAKGQIDAALAAA